VFDFDRYRRPEMYTAITAQRGVREPPDESGEHVPGARDT
jgi:hypothetical protein